MIKVTLKSWSKLLDITYRHRLRSVFKVFLNKKENTVKVFVFNDKYYFYKFKVDEEEYDTYIEYLKDKKILHQVT